MNCIKNSDAAFVDTGDDFHASIAAIWSRPFDDSSFEKDMPRLAHRIEIITKDYQQIGPFEGDSLAIMKRLVEAIAKDLEIPNFDAKYFRFFLCFSCWLSALQACDSLMNIYHLLGEDSVIMRLLKVVNQSIVLCGMQELRSTVCKSMMTKDIRDKTGWRVQFRLGNVIQATHIRREQSMDAFGDTANHFEFSWEAQLTFDRAMSTLHSTRLRILDLTVASSMDLEKREQLMRTLIDGLIIR